MAGEITITVDGVEVRTIPGKMVLEAAIEAGIYIPYLCYHPGMKPYAACRMCVVEVEGSRGYSASCTLPVQEGMVVKTNTQEVYQLRRGINEMLIAEHPHGCLTCHRIDLCGPDDICLRHVAVNDRCVLCPKNERCELKDTTRYLTMELESPLEYKYRTLPMETGDPFYDRDYNLCIVCGRCVRVCEEVRGDSAICFTERSGQALVGTSRGSSLLESGCEGCGACIDVCPVGALVERDYKWEKPARVVRSICPHCSVGCQINYEVNRFDKVIRAVPELNSPANHGQACFKGKFGFDSVNRKERLKQPLLRRDGELQEVSWYEALTFVAERLARYRGDQFALIASARGTNEDNYIAQKFARVVMGTNNVDHNSNTRPALVEGLVDTLGYAASTNPIWELEQARCVLVVNSNITEEHNVAAVPIKKAVSSAGQQLIVIDPREVELTHYAHLWLRPRPGTELTLLAGVLRSVVDQGLVQEAWVQEHCQGYDELRASLEAVDLDAVARETEVPRERVEEAARLYASSGASAILYALDNVAQEQQGPCVHALADLALLTGNLGKPFTGLYALRQGTNEQGSWDVGCVPHLLPGYRDPSDPQVRGVLEEVWGASLPTGEGLGLRQAFDAARQGTVKAMLLIGDSLALHSSELGDVTEALESLELLVVQDLFLSPLAQRAQVVLPQVSYAEQAGTYTNLERRVQRLRAAVSVKKSEARTAWWALCQLAQQMGAAGFDYQGSADILEEIASLVPLYGGITRPRLRAEARPTPRPDPSNPLPTQVLYSDRIEEGLLWPCPDTAHPGTPILYAEGFPGGMARLLPVQPAPTAPSQDGEWPLLFLPGRVLLQPEREMEVVRASGSLKRIQRDEWVELHPEDAAALGIAEGAAVVVTTTPGQRISGVARLNPALPRGSVAVTLLFGQLALELEASEDPDPMSKVPGLVIAPAQVTRV